MKNNQFELAEPRKIGKSIVGKRLYQAFQPLEISSQLLKHYSEYMLYQNGGRCWACGRLVGREYLECGHLIDKVCGGNNLWNNIRPMCGYCNQIDKPLHNTIREVLAWRVKRWKEAAYWEESERYVKLNGGIGALITRCGGG
jgi:hypothetical protein